MLQTLLTVLRRFTKNELLHGNFFQVFWPYLQVNNIVEHFSAEYLFLWKTFWWLLLVLLAKLLLYEK